MSNRRQLLRAQLAEAWRSTVRGPYAEHLLNSERGLQVHFCIALFREFERTRAKRSLFIEPTITFDGTVRRSPDLLICTSRQVVGAVEFKYTPRAKPSFSKDLDTLARIGGAGDGKITVRNERFRGEGTTKHYTVASDAVLCWAAVHSNEDLQLQLPPRVVARLGTRFLYLDAVTRAGAPAKVRPARRERSDA